MNFGYSARCTNPECGVRIKLFRYLGEAITVWNNRTGKHEEPIMYTYVRSNNPEREKKCLLIPHCPLCGSKAHVKLPPIGFLDPRGYYSVHCSNLYECGFTTREHDELPDGEVYGTVMYAVEEWNRRPNN